jgi:hypothetical protein
VARTVNALTARLGLEAASLGGHALRSGFLTSAAARGFQAGRSVAAHRLLPIVRRLGGDRIVVVLSG